MKSTPPSPALNRRPLIKVTGEGAASARADRILLKLELDRTGKDTEAVEARLSGDRRTVADALARTKVPPARIRSHGMQIMPWWKWENNVHVFKGFRAREAIVVRIPYEAGRVNELVRALAQVLEHVRIDVDFIVREPAEARRRALESAVADARQKAETIARAAGGRLGKLREISDESVEFGFRGGTSLMSKSELRERDSDEFSAVDQEVFVRVTGTWEIKGKSV